MFDNKREFLDATGLVKKTDHFLVNGKIRVNPEFRNHTILTIRMFNRLVAMGYATLSDRKIVLTKRGRLAEFEYRNRRQLLRVNRRGVKYIERTLSPTFIWPDFLMVLRDRYVTVDDLGNVVITNKGRKAVGLKVIIIKRYYRTVWLNHDELAGFETYCQDHKITVKTRQIKR